MCACMHAEIGDDNFTVEVIGHFSEEDARQYAEYTFTKAGQTSHLTDDDWHRIYEVRNGIRPFPVQLLFHFVRG